MINKLETIVLKSIVMKDPEYFTRRVCRYYSEKFHTPLLEVHELPWAFVFTNYLEHVVETNNSQKEIYDLALEVIYPEVSKSIEEENIAFAKMIEKQEEERMAKEAEAKAAKIIEEKMKEDNIEMTDFSHLDEEMEEED